MIQNRGPVRDSRTKAQLALIDYFPNYPAASEYIKWFLSCGNFVVVGIAVERLAYAVGVREALGGCDPTGSDRGHSLSLV